jgi:hypothetical protein
VGSEITAFAQKTSVTTTESLIAGPFVEAWGLKNVGVVIPRCISPESLAQHRM